MEVRLRKERYYRSVHGFMIYPGVAPEIFRRGADSSDEGLKYIFEGTISAKNLRKNRFSSSDWGPACSDGGAIAPLALPWRHPWIYHMFASAVYWFYFISGCKAISIMT